MVYNQYTYDEYGNIDGILNITLQRLESGKVITYLTYEEINTDIDIKVDNLLQELALKSV